MPDADALPERGRICAVDFGSVRHGLAVADLEVRIASPLETYPRRSEALDARYFQRLAGEERIVRWVVGLPVQTGGGETRKSQEARRFGAWLTRETGVAVDFFDERYTTVHAEELLIAADIPRKSRKKRIDALAAQILLTAYLEAGARGDDDPGPLG